MSEGVKYIAPWTEGCVLPCGRRISDESDVATSTASQPDNGLMSPDSDNSLELGATATASSLVHMAEMS